MSRSARLQSSKEWIKNYTGKNIIKGYANWYATDWICAMVELRMNGVEISEEEIKIRKSVESRLLNRKLRKERREQKRQTHSNALIDPFSNDQFAYIAGYTSNGVPFGITHEEMDEFPFNGIPCGINQDEINELPF